MKLKFLGLAMLATMGLVGCGDSSGGDSTESGTYSSAGLTMTETFYFDSSAGNMQRGSMTFDGNKIYETLKNVVGNSSGDINSTGDWYTLSKDALVHYTDAKPDSNGRYLRANLAGDATDTNWSLYIANTTNSTDIKSTMTSVILDVSGKAINSVFSSSGNNVDSSKLANVTGVFPAGSSCSYTTTSAVNKEELDIFPSDGMTPAASFTDWQTTNYITDVTSDTWSGVQLQKGFYSFNGTTSTIPSYAVLWSDNKVYNAWHYDANTPQDMSSGTTYCDRFNKTAADAVEAAFVVGYK